MSGCKNILVPFGDAESGAAPLEAALRLAPRLEAHVTALHVRAAPTASLPMIGEGLPPVMAEQIVAIGTRRETDRAEAARAAFDDRTVRLGVPQADRPRGGASATWLDEAGREEERVAFHGRLSDLIIMRRPAADDDEASLQILNAALMETGKPLLLVPPQPPQALGGVVAIAWNGSVEAGRAVAGAMPLLERAHRVTILSATHQPDAGAAAAESLAEALSWHGVAAGRRVLDASPAHAGEALLGAAAECGADLLVMGAYTHSRLRQLILGGVTSHVLHHATIPCLLAH